MVRKTIFSWLLIAVSVVSAAASITVTENTPQRLSFTFELEDLQTTVTHADGEAVTHLGFSGQNTELGDAGEVILPAQAIHIGLPPDVEIRVRFTALETRSVQLEAAAASKPEGIAQPHQPVFSDKWISQPQYRKIRGLHTARMLIRPVMVNRHERTALVLEKGSCTIEFPASPRGSNVSVPQSIKQFLDDLLLNYSVSEGWHVKPKRGLPKTAGSLSLPHDRNMLSFTIGDGHNAMREATVDENGIVRIEGEDILRAFPGNVQFEHLTLYAGAKHALSDTVPAADSIPAGIQKIPVIVHDLNSNGRVDNGDYLIAYVSGTSDWVFDRDKQVWEFKTNPYDDYRTYWLSLNKQSHNMKRYDPDIIQADDTVDYFENHIMYKNSTKLTSEYEDNGIADVWLTDILTSTNSTYSFDVGLPNATQRDSSAFLKIHTRSRSGGREYVSWNGSPFCDSCRNVNQWREITDWSGRRFQISFEGGANNYLEFEAIEVKYQRSLSMDGLQKLLIYSLPGTGTIAYRVHDLPSQECILLRIDEQEGSTTMIARIPEDQNEYTFVDSAGNGTRYFIAALGAVESVNASVYTPGSQSRYLIENTRAVGVEGDYLVIAPDDLVEQSIRLVRHKETLDRFQAPRVVRIEAIYRDFSGGTKDITAIRNFLVHAANSWSSPPEYVVLMGNGNYDYRGFGHESERNLIPAAIFDRFCLDDYFSYLDEGETPKAGSSAPDLFLGRITANDATEAGNVVDKIIEMEGPDADFGAWRGAMLLVADDDMVGTKDDPISTNKPHHISSERVAQVVADNLPSIDIRKLYLFEYPFDDFYEKPEAGRALINEINSGVGMVNYFGHGGRTVWTDEHIFRNENIANLTNSKRYPIVTSFSCNVGEFDRPREDCLSGALVKAPGGGAIAAVSSARKAYAQPNENLAQIFYDYLTRPGDAHSVGQAYALAKSGIHDSNQKSYSLLGDPSIRMVKITDSVEISLVDDNGDPLDSLMANQTFKIRGKIINDGELNSSYGTNEDSIRLAFHYPGRDSVTRKDGINKSVYYPLPGALQSAYKAKVVGGQFEQSVTFCNNIDVPSVLRLRAYAWGGEDIAMGVKDSIVISGTAASEITDTIGPIITVSPEYEDSRLDGNVGFTDKIMVMVPVGFQIDIQDESPIDCENQDPDEGITLEIIGATKKIEKHSINHKFQPSEDNRSGSVEIAYGANELKKGTYDMTITARDCWGNMSKRTIVLEVTDEKEFKMGPVFNYPNPVRMGESTRFFFHQSNSHANIDNSYRWRGDVIATIKIYTLSGKLIRIIRDPENGYVWDLRDEVGNMLTPNTYLYQITTDVEMPEFSKTEKSPVHKLVVHPPR
ncbi:MAG: C25 family cysteine peptidase [Chitinispirillaceae bacterium]